MSKTMTWVGVLASLVDILEMLELGIILWTRHDRLARLHVGLTYEASIDRYVLRSGRTRFL
jgi:hypothetical protein